MPLAARKDAEQNEYAIGWEAGQYFQKVTNPVGLRVKASSVSEAKAKAIAELKSDGYKNINVYAVSLRDTARKDSYVSDAKSLDDLKKQLLAAVSDVRKREIKMKMSRIEDRLSRGDAVPASGRDEIQQLRKGADDIEKENPERAKQMRAKAKSLEDRLSRGDSEARKDGYTKDDKRRLTISWEQGKADKARGKTLDEAVGNAPKGSPVGMARAAGWKNEDIDWWFRKDSDDKKPAEPKYNASAVQNEINKDKRIGGKEAKLIHSLLKGRHDSTSRLDSAIEKAQALSRRVELRSDAFVDGRELARRGEIQRSHTKYMKVGELFDYYTQSNGDKKQGKVTKLSGDSVTVGGETFKIVG